MNGPFPSHTTLSLPFGASYREVEVGRITRLGDASPLKLDCGAELTGFPLAWQSWGTLNKAKNNAVLVCHGLTGDQYAAGIHPVTGKSGWWDAMIGPGKPLDTDRYFILCCNVLGSCMGSYGPKSMDPGTGEPFSLNFPVITIYDMVRAQALLVEQFGIMRLLAVVGGSMGGMLTLAWAALYPERVHAAAPLATAARHTAQNIAFHEIGRQAIMADPDWCESHYFHEQRYPVKGLSVARMTAHVTYLSQEGLARKFGRGLQNRESITYGFDADFQVESYLRHQGMRFVERFDANAYLYITRAMDYFDLEAQYGKGKLAEAFRGTQTRFCVVAFSSDWLFPPEEGRHIARALAGVGAKVSFVEIETDKGHDAFLLDEPELDRTLSGFLDSAARELTI